MNTLFIRLFSVALWFAGLSLLSGCGFQLRGNVELPPVLQATYLKSNNPFEGVAPALRIELQSAGAQITENIDEATAVVSIINERSERRVLSVGSSGKASEYELFEEATFSVLDTAGNIILEQQTVGMTRDLVFDETELLGKVSEAEKLRKQMRRGLARQIITRISVGTRQP
jgi:LPS-assembly lipoprotein